MTRFNVMLAVIAATGVWRCVILRRVLRDLDQRSHAFEMRRRIRTGFYEDDESVDDIQVTHLHVTGSVQPGGVNQVNAAAIDKALRLFGAN